MPNMIDYVLWRGDIPFEKMPLCAVDALIFSYLSYMPFDGLISGDFGSDGVTLAQAAAYLKMSGLSGVCMLDCQKNDEKLFDALAASERFGGVRVAGYVSHVDDEAQKQFSAVTFLIGERLAFVSFRGTDSSVVGWKEDFNMSFSDTVPAQQEAVRYAQHAAAALGRRMILGGHSKGGNLAVYAGVFSDPDTQRSIDRVFNFDGPGFNEETITSPEFMGANTRIYTFVPQSSMIGILLWHAEAFTVVRSDGIGMLQHNPYTWQVMGGGFITVDELSGASRFADETLKRWLRDMEPDTRRRVIDGIYEVLSASDGRSVAELFEPRNILAILRAASGMDEETRSVIFDAFRALGAAVRESMPEFVDKAGIIQRVRGERAPEE